MDMDIDDISHSIWDFYNGDPQLTLTWMIWGQPQEETETFPCPPCKQLGPAKPCHAVNGEAGISDNGKRITTSSLHIYVST